MATALGTLVATFWDKLLRYAWKFGIVGLIGFFIDTGIFNLLRFMAGDENPPPFFFGPIGAKIVAVVVATVFTWFGNRYWTFREHRRRDYWRELFEFSVVAGAGMLIQLACLAISHYVLGFRTILADNISGNLIGLFLATAFRFLLYRFWVFSHHRTGALDNAQNKGEAAADAIFEDEVSAVADADKRRR